MTNEPNDLVSLAANAAMEAAEESLAESGAKLSMMFVTLVAEDLPEGEANANTAGWGFEHDGELMAFLLTTTQGVADSIGVDVRVIEVERGEG